MNESTAAKIKDLFLNNMEFRKEFLTNTVDICKKYGIDMGENTPIDFSQNSTTVEIKSMKCAVCDGATINGVTTDGYFVCSF